MGVLVKDYVETCLRHSQMVEFQICGTVADAKDVLQALAMMAASGFMRFRVGMHI